MPRHRKYRRLAERYGDRKPYGEQPDDQLLFSRMELMQLCAQQTLAKHSLIDLEKFQLGGIAVTGQPIPLGIAPRIAEANAADADLMEFIEVLAAEYTLLGADGLKARTELLEYRYDAV
ncbi:MAG: hypothetical protein PSV22_13365 [Pseudolabrys sp.]|nr:hypothetical protein [Pseudolabrys sp.]